MKMVMLMLSELDHEHESPTRISNHAFTGITENVLMAFIPSTTGFARADKL